MTRGVFACFASSQPTPEQLLRGVVSVQYFPLGRYLLGLEATVGKPGSLGVLEALVGITEHPDGSNSAPPITDWYYGWAAAWCAMTCSYGLAHGGFSDDGGETLNLTRLSGIAQTTPKGWAYVPYLADDFRSAGRYRATPEPGDLGVIADESHVTTIATVNDDGTVSSYEGNYSNGLYWVTRTLDAFDGFARPPWDLLAPPAPPSPIPTPEPDMTASPNVLFDHGTGVFVRFANGDTLLLENDAQVHAFDGSPSLGLVSDRQFARLSPVDVPPVMVADDSAT